MQNNNAKIKWKAESSCKSANNQRKLTNEKERSFTYEKFKTNHAPGDPRAHHQGEVRQGILKLKFKMDLISLFTNKSLKFLTINENIQIEKRYGMAAWKKIIITAAIFYKVIHINIQVKRI